MQPLPRTRRRAAHPACGLAGSWNAASSWAQQLEDTGLPPPAAAEQAANDASTAGALQAVAGSAGRARGCPPAIAAVRTASQGQRSALHGLHRACAWPGHTCCKRARQQRRQQAGTEPVLCLCHSVGRDGWRGLQQRTTSVVVTRLTAVFAPVPAAAFAVCSNTASVLPLMRMAHQPREAPARQLACSCGCGRCVAPPRALTAHKWRCRFAGCGSAVGWRARAFSAGAAEQHLQPVSSC